jgi:hypothetical protein
MSAVGRFPIQDERAAAYEFDVAVDAAGFESSGKFQEEGVDLSGVEFSAGQAVARLRSRMKAFMAASSGGVSDMVSCFMGSRMLR